MESSFFMRNHLYDGGDRNGKDHSQDASVITAYSDGDQDKKEDEGPIATSHDTGVGHIGIDLLDDNQYKDRQERLADPRPSAAPPAPPGTVLMMGPK